jgi:sec-independent protein translocase protein TatB
VFDIGFSELLIIGIVALLVLGPERLPAAARTVGGVLRKARQSWMSVRNEFERELSIEDMKRNARELRERVETGRPATATTSTATAASATSASAAGAGDVEPPPGLAPVPTRAPHD